MGGGVSKSGITVHKQGATDAESTYIVAGGSHGDCAVTAASAPTPLAAPGRVWESKTSSHKRGGVAPAATAPNDGRKSQGHPIAGSSIPDVSAPDCGPDSVASGLDNNASPIPISDGQGHVGYISLSDIISHENSNSKYIKMKSIGKGAYGEAYVVRRNPAYNPDAHPTLEAQVLSNVLANHTHPNGLYVAKIMDLRTMVSQDRQYAQTEIMCLAHTHHFAIIRYYEHYVLDSDDETVIIVTELADHGDLRRNLYNATAVRPFHDVGAHPPGTGQADAIASPMLLTEREAGTYFVQLLLALHHISARRMIHRDIKSANVLLTSRGFLKLGDFGFSQKYESTVSSETIAGTFLGTPYYLSPEMWRGKRYGKKADIWAAGVVLYEMLMGGRRPFEASGLPELRSCVLEKEFIPPMGPPSPGTEVVQEGNGTPVRFSNDMRELLASIFEKSPEKRPSAEELLHTPVMQHYLFVFEKYVQSLISSDEAALAANPAMDRQQLFFPDPADQAIVLQGISEGKEVITRETLRTMADSVAPRYEGVVYKHNSNGSWKERYLSLDGSALTISLSKGKEAVSGGERSKRVSLSSIKSVSPCEVEDVHVRVTAAASPADGYKPPYAFAIAMSSSNSITFGVASDKELDNWMQVLMRALQID